MLSRMAAHRRANGEGSVSYDRQKERWVGRALLPGGKYRKVIRRSKSEAQAALRSLLADIEHGSIVDDGGLTVRAVAERYRTRTLAGRDIAPATRERDSWAIGRVIDALGPVHLKSLTVDHVEHALDMMASEGLRHASLVKVRGAFARVLDQAVKRGESTLNAARLADLPPGAMRTQRRRSLTAEQTRAFLQACQGERLGPLFVLMVATGCRPGEACGLRWDAVDLEAGTVAIRTARRTGRRGRVEIVDELKTEQSRRTIGVSPWALEALGRHQHDQKVERIASGRWADEFLVFATSTGTPVGGPAMRKAFDAIVAKVNGEQNEPVIPEDLTPNELRHTAASLMVDGGMSLEHVAPVIGHKTTRMLEETYRHAVRPSIGAHLVVMDSLMADGTGKG